MSRCTHRVHAMLLCTNLNLPRVAGSFTCDCIGVQVVRTSGCINKCSLESQGKSNILSARWDEDKAHALVGAGQIDQIRIQIEIHGQLVTENSVELDQYSLISKCCTVQWPPQITNREHMVFQSQMRTSCRHTRCDSADGFPRRLHTTEKRKQTTNSCKEVPKLVPVFS
jgi:hypothetical protein